MAAVVRVGTVLTDSVVLAAAALCLTGLAVSGWMMFGRAQAIKPKDEGRTYNLLRCPECGDEVPYSPDLDGRTCEACDAGAAYVPAVGRNEAGPGRWGKVAAFLVVGLVLLPGSGILVLYRVRALRRAAAWERDQPLVSHCPYCGRRIGYPSSKAGVVFVCSRCKTAFPLPALDNSAAE